MAILPIRLYPDPILKEVCARVAEVTKETAKRLEEMAETMYAAPGIGLAGPQVGIKERLLVCDVSWREETPGRGTTRQLFQLVNPAVVKRAGEIEWEEGCLSIPGFLQLMKRSAQVEVTALDKKGKPIHLSAEGLLAVCLQHEIDHLDGKLIIDKASRLKRNLYLEKLKKGEFQTHYPTAQAL